MKSKKAAPFFTTIKGKRVMLHVGTTIMHMTPDQARYVADLLHDTADKIEESRR